jgi:outer membrane protein assembly factor BamB
MSVLTAAPTVSSFSPAAAAMNATVTISGTGFVSPVTVDFGSVPSTSVTVSSTTSIKATVPLTAASGPITVAAAGGSAKSSASFTVNPAASFVYGIEPPAGVASLQISGFAPFELVDVYFGTTDLELEATGATGAATFDLTVPASAPPGTNFVSVAGRRSGLAAQTSIDVQTNWPQYMDGPAHQSTNTYENVLSASTAGDLDLAWSSAAAKQSGHTVYSSPTVDGGTVYIEDDGAALYALNEASGALEWSRTGGTGELLDEAPAIAGGYLYVTGDGGLFSALRATSGALVWHTQLDAATVGSPTIRDGIAYVATDKGTVYAVNALTGAIAWQSSGAAEAGSPVVADGLVFVAEDAGVEAYSAATGAQAWSQSLANMAFQDLSYGDGAIYGVANTNLVALNALSGGEEWSASGASSQCSPAEYGGVVYAGAGLAMDAFSANTGDLDWTVQVVGGCTGPPAIANGVVYFSTTSTPSGGGAVYGVSTGGFTVWSAYTGALVGGPVVTDGQVTVADVAGDTDAFNLSADISPDALRAPSISELEPDYNLRPGGQ